MTIKRAVEVIEDLTQYAFDEWDELAYGKELEDIEKAWEIIQNYLSSNSEKIVGMAEIDGKKYVISKSE